MQFTQIATEGGLLPFPIIRDSFELWPAKRREFIVDFTKYLDGTPTTKGDVIYLTDVMNMPDGRMWSNSRFDPDPAYKVPLLKIVIGDPAPDDSVIPTKTRDLPPLPANWQSLLDNRSIFEVERGSAGGEIEWLINGKPFDPNHVGISLKNNAGKTPPRSRGRAAGTCRSSAMAAAARYSRCSSTWRSTAPSCGDGRDVTKPGADLLTPTTTHEQTLRRSTG